MDVRPSVDVHTSMDVRAYTDVHTSTGRGYGRAIA